MARYRIHMINSAFQSCEESDFPSVEVALRSGILAATNVASEQVAAGESHSTIEVRVEEGGRFIARRIITLSVSDLAIPE